MATKPTTGRKNSGAAADILGQLAALVPAKTPPKAGKADKWYMPLTPEAEAEARRWVEAKTVIEPVEKRMENAKAEFSEYALRYMAERLFKEKNKPSNPLIALNKKDDKGKDVLDHQLQFTMTDRFKYRFPDVPEGTNPRDHFIEVFQNVGLHPSDAEKLVDEELDFNPVTGIKSLTLLMEGRLGEGREWIESDEASKTAGRKLAALLMWMDGDPAPEALTLEEKALVIERSPSMTVKAGFYGRVATYCRSVDQLMGVFKVIQPIAYPAYAKFAVNDSPTDKNDRMIAAAADILGTVASSDSDD